MTKSIIIFALVFTSVGLMFSQEQPDTVRYHFPPVTISAARMLMPWIEVPMAIDVLQQGELQHVRGYGLDEALSNIPGVLAQSRAGSTDIRLSIRGFGARGAGARSNAGTSRGVRILTNGFPETEPDGRTSYDMIDISGAGAIEVIRSNASSVYGNASGGVVNIISNTAFESPFVSLSKSYGSFGFRKDMLNTGAMLGSGRMYLSLSNINSDGWRYHSNSTQTMLTTGIVADVGERTNIGVHIAASSNLFHIPGALTQSQYDSLPQQADSALFIKRDERRFNRLGRIGVTASHEIDDNNMISASAFVQPKYLERSERNQYRQFNRYHVGGGVMYRNTITNGPNSRNILLLGMDEAFQDGSIQFYNRYNILPTMERGTLRDNKREGANNFGVFLEDEISFNESWIFLLGARYDNITYSYESFFDPAIVPVEKSFVHVTPKAGITYRISSTQSIYANIGGGVEVPAGNETDSDPLSSNAPLAINPLLEPISSMTLEVGTKQTMLLGGENPCGNLTYNVAAYWLQVNNDIIPYSNGTLFFTAGKTQRMGLEFGGDVRLNIGLSFTAAFTVSSNKYKDYDVDSVHYDTAKAGHFASYADNKVVGVPDIFFNLGTKYAPEGLRGGFVSLNLQSVGNYFVDDANKLSIPSYAVLNAGIGIDHLTFDNAKIFLNCFLGVNNITDVKYVGSAWLNPDIVNGKPVFIEPGLPRNFFGSLSLGLNL